MTLAPHNMFSCHATPAESSVREDAPTPTPTTALANAPAPAPPSALALAEGDLVWGPARGSPSWPGQVVTGPEAQAQAPGQVWVRWFSGCGGGGDRSISLVSTENLKSLSEGLEAHHRAIKKFRKGRKMNSQLENAIQEAMAELDKMSEKQKELKDTISDKSSEVIENKDETIHSQKPVLRTKSNSNSTKRLVQNSMVSKPEDVVSPGALTPSSSQRSNASSTPAHFTRLRRSQR